MLKNCIFLCRGAVNTDYKLEGLIKYWYDLQIKKKEVEKPFLLYIFTVLKQVSLKTGLSKDYLNNVLITKYGAKSPGIC
jgi:hypothetical protein